MWRFLTIGLALVSVGMVFSSLLPGVAFARPHVSAAPIDDLRATSLRNYLSIKPDALGLDVVDGPELNQILISLPKGESNGANLKFSSSPPRLTLELPAWKGTRELKAPGIHTSFVSGLKVSPAKNGGARMTISLSAGRKLEHQFAKGQGKGSLDSLVISISPLGRLQNLLTSLPAGYRRPLAVVDDSSDTQSASLTGKDSNSTPIVQQPATVSPPSTLESKTSSARQALLSTIKMPLLESGENMLVLEADTDMTLSHELQALGNSTYTLRLKNTRLSETATMTSLYPGGSGTLGSIRTFQQGSDALVKIFCASETPLRLRTSGKTAILGTEEVLAAYDWSAGRK